MSEGLTAREVILICRIQTRIWEGISTDTDADKEYVCEEIQRIAEEVARDYPHER